MSISKKLVYIFWVISFTSLAAVFAMSQAQADPQNQQALLEHAIDARLNELASQLEVHPSDLRKAAAHIAEAKSYTRSGISAVMGIAALATTAATVLMHSYEVSHPNAVNFLKLATLAKGFSGLRTDWVQAGVSGVMVGAGSLLISRQLLNPSAHLSADPQLMTTLAQIQNRWMGPRGVSEMDWLLQFNLDLETLRELEVAVVGAEVSRPITRRQTIDYFQRLYMALVELNEITRVEQTVLQRVAVLLPRSGLQLNSRGLEYCQAVLARSSRADF